MRSGPAEGDRTATSRFLGSPVRWGLTAAAVVLLLGACSIVRSHPAPVGPVPAQPASGIQGLSPLAQANIRALELTVDVGDVTSSGQQVTWAFPGEASAQAMLSLSDPTATGRRPLWLATPLLATPQLTEGPVVVAPPPLLDGWARWVFPQYSICSECETRIPL